jgi:heme exporter protein D
MSIPFFFTSINVYTYWSHWRTTSIYLHASFSPPSTSFQGVGIVWQAVSATYIALVLCVVHNVAAELKEKRESYRAREPLHPAASNKVRLLLRRVLLLLLLGCNQVEWMWHSPLSIHKYISLYERVYKVSKKESGQRSSSTRESQRAMMLAREYISYSNREYYIPTDSFMYKSVG